MRARVPVLLAAALATLVLAGPAAAHEVVREDAEGRDIRFDVPAEGVDVDWYADLLRNALHGDEIERVTVRIVSWDDVASSCGPDAGGCYGHRVIVVPAGQGSGVAHTLLHEYGHHVDRSLDHSGGGEPNGTARWWRARAMPRLVEAGSVAGDYSLGWDRSIAEIFAEDYASLHLDAPYKIGWLEPPRPAVLDAIRRDLGAAVQGPEAAEPARPAYRPVVVARSGVIGPGERRAVPFGLLGPNRRVTFSARVTGSARLVIVCDGRPVAAKALERGRRSATIDLRRLGPAECEARLESSSSQPQRFAVRLRLAVAA